MDNCEFRTFSSTFQPRETICLTPQVHDTSEHVASAAMVLGHPYINWTSISPSNGNIHPADSQRRTSMGWNEISDMMVCHFFLRFRQFHHYVQKRNTGHQLYTADATRNRHQTLSRLLYICFPKMEPQLYGNLCVCNFTCPVTILWFKEYKNSHNFLVINHLVDLCIDEDTIRMDLK